MNINNYISKLGHKTFDEMPFNDIDGLILSELSFVNFDIVVPSIDVEQEALKIGDIDAEDKVAFYKGSVDYKYNQTMFELMQKSNRFKDIKVGYYQKQFSKNNIVQFFSIAFILPDNTLYLSFRGTDTTIVGWKEDFLLAFAPTMPSHELALQYVRKMINKFPDSKYYLGGHSKGGNIAFYVACHLNEKQSERLIGAYSYDGPGFKDGIKYYPSFERNKAKLYKYLTYNDVIGYFYKDVKAHKVVNSNGLLLGGHDPFFWQVNSKGEFITSESTSGYAKVRAKKLIAWLNSLSKQETKLIFDAVFDVFGENDTIYDLAKNLPSNLLKTRKTMEKYSEPDKKLLIKSIKMLIIFILTPTKRLKIPDDPTK